MSGPAGAHQGIRVGVVGTGPITERFATAVAEVDGIHIEAVSSRDPGRAASAAERLGALSAVTGFDALLDPGRVDAVYIASPNSVHLDQAHRAIDASLHVLVEKPAVDTAAQWRGLVDAASARGVVVIEAMRTAHDPGTAKLRELLPQIGVVRHASLRHVGRSARYDLVLAGERVNIFDPEMSGGALRDLGVYVVYAMTSMFGMPRAIANSIATVGSGADGAGAAVAAYDGFAVALEYSKVTTSRLPSEINGELGTLSIDHVASPRVIELAVDGEVERFTVEGPQHVLTGEVERFASLVRGESDPTSDQQSTWTCLQVIEAMEESARTHASVRLRRDD